MKKVINLTVFTLIIYLSFANPVLAEDATINLQCEQGVVDVFKLLGYALYIIKILVPILLMIMSSVDMAKAIIGDKQDEVMTQTKVIFKRVIASLVIFLLPTVINYAFHTLAEVNSSADKYKNLTNCLENPTQCTIGSGC